ncbi:MAG: acyltransferase family protein [Pseudorhodoplanes sp.]
METNVPDRRVEWVDYARGICIILVVMMHATLGVEAAVGQEGWMHGVVAFFKPFRIPTFFLVAGLFAHRVIDRDWSIFFDKKVLRFAYFYILWLTITFAFKLPGRIESEGLLAGLKLYLVAFVDPFGSLWFIYLLPIFFLAVRWTRTLPVAAVWLFAAALEIAPIETGWVVIDEFAARFVYFYTGHIIASWIFGAANGLSFARALALIAAGGLLNFFCVQAGYADWPLVSLALGFAGAAAIVAASVLVAREHLLSFFGYCGRISLMIYLSFFLPVATARLLLVHSGVIKDVGTISAIVTVAGVLGAIALYRLSLQTPLSFLFERPRAFRADELSAALLSR